MRFPQTISRTPSKPALSTTKITEFKGLDLSHAAMNVEITRSPDAKNMIRDEIGQVRKRLGFYTTKKYANKINGAFYYDDKLFVHSGANLYLYEDSTDTPIGALADHKTQGFILGSKLYILDGTKIRMLSKSGTYGNATTTVSGGSVTVDMPRFIEAWNTFFTRKMTPGTHVITYNSSNWSMTLDGTVCLLGTTEQMRDNLYIDLTGTPVDGDTITLDTRSYTLTNLDSQASTYIPMVIISRNPLGGGTPYEGYNLLGAGFTNSFYVDSSHATEKIFQLTAKDLDDNGSGVTAQIMDANGEWQTTTAFTVDAVNGKVAFNTAPGKSPIDGNDNVRITAYKTFPGKADMINKCTIGTLYGINGSPDRLFVSGNPDYPNRDWYSALYDPTYFADESYSVLGGEDSPIVGYTVVANKLATHKGDAEDGRNVIMREGEVKSTDYKEDDIHYKEVTVEFKITNTLIGESSIAPFAHNYLGREPLFLTKRGIYAITSEDVTGEKFSQKRSYYLDAALAKEPNLDKAVSAVYNDFYMLFVNSKVYCLDSLQKSYARDEPYSSFQYEGYLLTDIPACVVWTHDSELWFGTEQGQICKFFTDKAAATAYVDNLSLDPTLATPVESYWDTPFISGSVRHNRKTFSYISVTLAPAVVTGVTAYGKKFGIYNKLFDEYEAANYFDFANVDFSRLSFNTDTSPVNVRKPIRVSVVDKTQFRLENNRNESFGIYDITLEFTENGKF